MKKSHDSCDDDDGMKNVIALFEELLYHFCSDHIIESTSIKLNSFLLFRSLLKFQFHDHPGLSAALYHHQTPRTWLVQHPTVGP